MILNAIVYFVLYLLALRVWDSFKNRGDVAKLVLGLRPRHAGWGLLLLTTTLLALTASAAIATMWAPWLQWSWLSAITGHGGSAFSAPAQAEHRVPRMVIVCLYALLVLATPFMALLEERVFRNGAERRSPTRNTAMAVGFGLGHMAVGFPVFAAIALAPMGGVLTWLYRRRFRQTQDAVEATFEAGRAHLINNLMAIALIATLFLVTR